MIEISEMFEAPQGEGRYIGRQSLYVRFNRCNLSCFDIRTHVYVRECGTKRIGDVIVGEEVLSWDGHKLCYSPVVRVTRRTVSSYLKLHLSTGILRVTPNHLFRVGGKWKKAKDLEVGEEVFSLKPFEVRSFRRKINNPMYNLASVRQAVKNRDYDAIGRKVSLHRKTHYWSRTLSKVERHEIARRMRQNNPMKNSSTVAKVVKANRRNGNYARAAIRMKTLMKQPGVAHKVISQNRRGHMSKPEKRVLLLAQQASISLQYVGGGEGALIIRGRCPDFLVPGTKKVVEVFDGQFDYFGKGKRNARWRRNRAAYFSRSGYETLFIDSRLRDDDLILQLLSDYVHNGIRINKIERVDSNYQVGKGNLRSLVVCDLEVEGSHTYFVRPQQSGAVLVHNCSWCDSKYTWDKNDPEYGVGVKTYANAGELATAMLDFIGDQDYRVPDPMAVVFTGGEPLIYQRYIPDVIDMLREQYHIPIEVETAGTITPSADMLRRCHFNVSHKPRSAGNNKAPLSILRNEEATRMFIDQGDSDFKHVVARTDTDEEVEEYIFWLQEFCSGQIWWKDLRKRVYLMPEGADVDTVELNQARVIRLSQKHGVMATTRMHIIAWGDERGK